MQTQIRPLVRRAAKFALIGIAICALGIALEATIRGTLKSPEDRVATTLYTRPDGWGGTRSRPVALGSPNGRPLEARTPVSLSDLPDHLIQAVLAVEDQRFYQHHGLDFRRMGGAFFANVRAGGIRQGGSTLTQQLAKNLFLSRNRTLLRKAREAALALALESRYDKGTILEAYLNEIYLGQDGARPIHGVGAAARYYFGKDVERIGLAESALLAGMIQAPNRYVPDRHPESARQRRELVLTRMIEQLRVNGPAARRAAEGSLPRRVHPTSTLDARWFRDQVERDVRSLPARGVAVYTTMDATLQRAAERAVQAGIRRLRRQAPGVEAALVALDPRTGDILALVGGADYGTSQFNRATQARRQPGSAFKPIVALAALERRDDGNPQFTLATMVDDAPLSVRAGGTSWQPANYDGQFHGEVTVREAMEQSLNVPFARIGMQVGSERIVATARRFGIAGPLRPVPSLALGSSEVTLLELARAYGVFAAQGELAASRTVLGSARHGARLEGVNDPVVTRVADPAAAYLVTSTLQGVVTRGTGRALNAQGRFEGIAGKTGTSNDWRDAWFVAYSPELVVAVWVGRDDGQSIGMSGATAALPIVAGFLSDIEPEDGWDGPRPPDGLIEATVSAGAGDWFGECGTTEVFLEGTEPAEQGCWQGDFGSGFRVDFGEGFSSEAILQELYRRWGDRLEGPAADLVEQVMDALREAAHERREGRRN